MNYKLEEIFDIEELKSICESFTELTGAVTAMLDLEGNVHIATGWQPICTQFHRINKETNKRCTESDTILAGQLNEGKKYSIYKCKNGLTDVAMPIMVKDIHIGNFFTGQFLTQKPDIEYFRKQAKQFGFDEQEYLNALKKVPIYSDDKIEKTIQFLVQLTETIGNIGVRNLESLETNKQLEIERKNASEADKEFQIAQKALNENEEKFRNIAEQVAEMIFLTDNKGMIKYISPASSSIFGFTPQEMEKKLFMKFLKKTEVPKAMKEFVKTSIKGISTINLELLMKHKNGNYFYGELNGRNYNSDKLKGTIGVIRDISERKQADIELKKSKQKYELLIKNSPDLLMSQNIDGKITYISPQCEEILGFTIDEIMNLNIPDQIHPEDLEMTQITMFNTLKGKELKNLEYRFIKKNGDIVWLNHTARPIIIDDKISEIQSTVRDITDHKMAEEILSESRERMESFMNSSTESFTLYDSKLNLIDINKISLIKFFPGFKKEDIIGKNLLEISPDLKQTGIWDKYMGVIKTGKPFLADNFIPHPKFGDIYLSVKAFKVGDGMGMITTDVTEAKLAEEKLLKSN